MRTHTRSILLYTVFCLAMLRFAASSASAAPVNDVLPGDVQQKYARYVEIYKLRHMHSGGTAEVLLDEETKSVVQQFWGLGDSQGWAGLTMAAFAFQRQWDLVRANLSYWDVLEVEPGRYKRYPEIPADYGHGQTSIDQYGEMYMGLAALALVGPDDLKRQAARIVGSIITYGKANTWIMGEGPWTDITNTRMLLQLLAEKLELNEDVLAPGETREQLLDSFLQQFKNAYLVRTGSTNYFTLNLYFERMFVAKILAPDLPGLDAAIREWYKAVKRDGNTMFDWFYARAAGRDTAFVVDALRAFPADPPNEWVDDGYNLGYRWERSPEEVAEPADGRPIEYTGMDFLALASFYAYFEARNGF